jgi:Carboxypeptidase regulatory-like domain
VAVFVGEAILFLNLLGSFRSRGTDTLLGGLFLMNRLRITLFAVLFIAVLFSTVPLAFSQTITTGDVVGVVTDTSGAVVPGATVTIKSVDTNETRTATSSDQGEYRFPLMKPGDYILSASTAGLKSNNLRFTMLVGQEQKLNVTMNPQGTNTIVEVTAEASVVQTENANLATSYSIKQVQELPMAGGDLTTLAMTVPGVRVNVKGGSGNMNANGVPGSSVLFTLNGADVMDPYNNLNNSGASNNLLGQNEVAEAAVALNAFSAQYGRMAGGQENIVGKSGSNAFHANLLYNFNYQGLNAMDFFAKLGGAPKTRSDAHQFGMGGGGPIIKNKTFFYTDYEGLRYVLPATTTAVFPSKQLQAFALAHVPTVDVPLYQAAFNLYNNAPGVARAVDVTNGPGLFQDSRGNLGCQSKGTFLAYAKAQGSTLGVSTPCAITFQSSNNQVNVESLFIARVDHNISSKQKINFRYQYDWGLQDSGTMNYTYIISPNLVNSFIGGGSWYAATFGVADFAKTTALMPERFAFGDGGTNAGGFNGVGAGFPTGRNVGQAQLIDDLSWTKGRHTIKGGMNFRYNKVTDTSIASNTTVGSYSFQDLTDFANGTVNGTGKGSAFTQGFPVLFAGHIRVYSLNFYVQDDWAIAKNLKLSYGIRFERDGNPGCTDNCFARMNEQFGTAAYNSALGSNAANVPYNQTITTGLHNAYAGLESVIPEPRFSFAWTPLGVGPKKPVLRGGVGLFANLFAASVAANLFGNFPQKFSPSVSFGNAGTMSDPNSSAAAGLASFNALEAGFKNGSTLAQIQAALGKITLTPPGYYSPPQDFKAPKILQWNFEIEEPLTNRDVLAVTYTGNHGYDESLTNADANLYSPVNSTYTAGGYGGLPLTAPDARFRTVSQVITAGKSNYDALIVQVRHSYGRGFQGQIGYTWSHALGNVLITNPYNLQQGYGALSFDTRHMLTGDLIWTDPYKTGNRYVNWVVSNWTWGTKFYAYSGPPLSATNSAIAAQINSLYSGTNTIEADLIDPSIIGIHCSNSATTGGTPCFKASQFGTSAGQRGFGTNPNIYRGTGYFDIDSQVTKNFSIKEKAKLGLGVQFYNILNHPNYANPSGSVTSSALGFISSTVVPPTSIYGSFQSGTVSGRVIELMGKFSF